MQICARLLARAKSIQSFEFVESFFSTAEVRHAPDRTGLHPCWSPCALNCT